MVAKMNGLICGGRLEATQTDVSMLLKTLSHAQTMSTLNADKLKRRGKTKTKKKVFVHTITFCSLPEHLSSYFDKAKFTFIWVHWITNLLQRQRTERSMKRNPVRTGPLKLKQKLQNWISDTMTCCLYSPTFVVQQHCAEHFNRIST